MNDCSVISTHTVQVASQHGRHFYIHRTDMGASLPEPRATDVLGEPFNFNPGLESVETGQQKAAVLRTRPFPLNSGVRRPCRA